MRLCASIFVSVNVSVCVCVCEREREKREIEIERAPIINSYESPSNPGVQ